jgi:hypothetical protein
MATTMSRHLRTTIRYDGPALSKGEMDVQDLAPALLAIAEIAKIANHKFNGDRASITVLVNADIEHRCFQLDLSLVQSWIDQARALIGDDNVTTLEQIGIIVGYTSASVGGLFAIYKWAFGKGDPQPNVTVLNYVDARGTVILVTPDGSQFEADAQAWELAKDPVILPHMKAVVAPLRREGYSDFQIIEGTAKVVDIDKSTAQTISKAQAPVGADDDEQPFVSPVDGQVEIHTAQFKGSAQWGLWWTGRVRLMKIEDEEWLQRYQSNQVPEAVPGAWLDVAMEITQPRDKKLPASFVVKKVKGVLPPEGPQASMFDGNS